MTSLPTDRIFSAPNGIDQPSSSFAQPIVVILGKGGTILFVNEAWKSFCLGSSDSPDPEDWVGRNYLDVARESQVEEGGEGLLVTTALTDLLAGKRKRFEITYACNRGDRTRWFKMLCRAVSSSRQVRAVIMLIDVTQAFLGEQSVREREERLASLIEEKDSDLGAEKLNGAAIEAVVTTTQVLDAVKGGGPRVRLSPREQECLLWTAYGLRSKEISGKLGITTKTVEHHLARAKQKLNSRNRVEAVTRAIALNLIQP